MNKQRCVLRQHPPSCHASPRALCRALLVLAAHSSAAVPAARVATHEQVRRPLCTALAPSRRARAPTPADRLHGCPHGRHHLHGQVALAGGKHICAPEPVRSAERSRCSGAKPRVLASARWSRGAAMPARSVRGGLSRPRVQLQHAAGAGARAGGGHRRTAGGLWPPERWFMSARRCGARRC
jgi:hypothetical protein